MPNLLLVLKPFSQIKFLSIGIKNGISEAIIAHEANKFQVPNR
jgi:hypothetical protein